MQTDYPNSPEVAREGGLAFAGEHETRSVISDDLIPFGRVVVRDSGSSHPDGVKLPAASGDITAHGQVMGASVATQSVESRFDGEVPSYPANFMFPALREGSLYLRAVGAVDPSKTVYAIHTDGDGSTLGMVRGSNTNASEIVGARFMGSADDDELVEVQFNLPA